VEDANHAPGNPYTAIEGYGVHDTPGGVPKHLGVDGWSVPGDRMDVSAERERVPVPYEGETIASAPQMREHFESS